MSNLSKEQVIMEYIRCMRDTPYALKTYLQTYDNTVSKYVPLELFPDQISLLTDYENFSSNVFGIDEQFIVLGFLHRDKTYYSYLHCLYENLLDEYLPKIL